MPELQKKLTLFDLTMIAIGSTIGSGIFLTPSSIAKALPSPFWILLVWVVGGLMALSGALTFAELGARMPGVGGVYVYLREAYGGLAGFLYGWAYFLVVNTGGVFSDVFTLLKLVGIAGVIIVGLGWGSSETTNFAAPLGDLQNGLTS